MFLSTNLFARTQCPVLPNTEILPHMVAASDTLSCLATKEQYNCEELEKELEGDEKNRIIKCDKKSLDEQSLGNTSFKSCIWNGIVMSGESLLDIAKLPGNIAGAIAKGFKETQLCNNSIEKKREILNAFNLTIEDERFKLTENFVGKWLEDAPCSEIEKLLSARYQNYQNTIYRDRINMINSGKGKDLKPLKQDKSSGPGLVEMLKSALAQAGTRYQCYSPKVKAEMICAGITTLLVDTVAGGGILMAAKKMTAIVKSKRALSRMEEAIKDGKEIMLSDASKLLAGDRLKAARELLGLKRPLMDSEKRAILESHEVGIKEGRGFFTYTQQDISQKVKLLKEAGFTRDQIRILMEAGVTGTVASPQRAMIAGTLFKGALRATSNATPAQANTISGFLEAVAEASKISATSTGSLEKVIEIAKKTISKDEFNPIQIEMIAGEFFRKKQAIMAAVEQTENAVTQGASAVAGAAVKPPIAGAPAGQAANAGNSGVTLTSANGSSTTATAQRAVGSTTSPAPTQGATSTVKPSGTTSPTPPKPAAAAPAEFALDAKKLQKARDDVDAAYVAKKDKVYAARLDNIPEELTQADMDMLKKLTGTVKDRELDTIRRFLGSVSPDDLQAFLKNPSNPLPQTLKNLKMAFPKLSKDNIEELLVYGKKVPKDEMEDFMRARTKKAQTQLEMIYGKDSMEIKRTIDLAFDEARVAQAQLKSWEAKLADPKTPNYSKQGLADQVEVFKRKLEIEKVKCKKILDLYIVAYNVTNYAEDYKRKYRDTCGTLE